MKRLILSLFVLGCSVAVQAKGPGVIAHRGYWTVENSAQNSMSSMKNAFAIKAYGSELDVYITTDGQVVLFHDATFNGERIDDMTYAQTQEIKLSNGESLPLLTEVLSEADKQNKTKLIIEIKPHDTQQKENDAVDAVLELVRHAKMEKKVEYISFSRNICERLISKEPKAKVAYLGGELTPQQLCDLGYSGLDYHIATMRAHEDWFDEAKRLGLTVNVWTVDDEEDMKWLIEKHADYITTNQPVVLQRLLNDR